MISSNIPKRTLYHTIYNYLSMFSTMVLSVLTTRYITKKLSVDEFGIYNILLVMIMIFSQILAFGFPSAMLRFVPELEHRNNLTFLRKILVLTFYLIFLCSIAFFIIGMIFGKRFAIFIGQPKMSFYLPVLVFLGAIRISADILSNVLNAQFMQGFRNLFDIIAALFQLIFSIIVLTLNWGIWGLILTLGFLDLFLISVYLIKMHTFFKLKGEFSIPISEEKKFLKRYYTFSLKEYLYKSFSFFWSAWIDIYFIKYFLGAHIAGIFAFAITIAFYLFNWNPAIAMQSIIRPLFAHQFIKGNDTDELKFNFNLYNKFCVFFTLPSFLFSTILIDKIIPMIFDQKYLASARIFLWLLPFLFLQVLLHPIRNVLAAIERNEITAYSNIIIFYKIAMSYLLIPIFKIKGVILAFGTSVILIFAIQFILTKKVIKIYYPWSSFAKITLNTLVSAFVVFILKPYIINLLTLFCAVFIGITIYFFLSYKNKAFSVEERKLFNKAFKIPLWQF